MKIVNKKIEDLIPYDKNTKKHDAKQIKNVAESIKKYGFVQPVVVDKNNVIVIGHCRHLAAKQLKMKQIPCVCVDDLTEDEVRALRIVDNKTNESPWDIDFLPEELEKVDLKDFEFDFFNDIKPEDEKEKVDTKALTEMELKAFEHYDYIVFVFKNSLDFLYAANEFNLQKLDAGYGSTKKVGIGRVLDAAELIKRIGNKDADNKQGEKSEHKHNKTSA